TLPQQTQDSLQMLWLTAYLMGLPPTGLYTLCWTHGQTPMWSKRTARAVPFKKEQKKVPQTLM
ncbi:hypothetical protein, partial [Blautia sp. HCN-1074]|uniref:hypothetical protein n=1 Tax=Blautia sp. HCN-1074 TaxID=3134667 RepID=UPI0030C34606